MGFLRQARAWGAGNQIGREVIRQGNESVPPAAVERIAADLGVEARTQGEYDALMDGCQYGLAHEVAWQEGNFWSRLFRS